MVRTDEFVRVDRSFYNLMRPKIVRDEKVRRFLKKTTPNTKIYKSWKDCTRELAAELRRKGL
jgi:hypothetical protein